MTNLAATNTFWLLTGGSVLLVITGIYCVMITRNMVRLLIGLELMMKGVTLLVIMAGALTGRAALAQALVIALITVEVVVMVVAAGIVISVYRHTKSLDTAGVMRLKG